MPVIGSPKHPAKQSLTQTFETLRQTVSKDFSIRYRPLHKALPHDMIVDYTVLKK